MIPHQQKIENNSQRQKIQIKKHFFHFLPDHFGGSNIYIRVYESYSTFVLLSSNRNKQQFSTRILFFVCCMCMWCTKSNRSEKTCLLLFIKPTQTYFVLVYRYFYFFQCSAFSAFGQVTLGDISSTLGTYKHNIHSVRVWHVYFLPSIYFLYTRKK